MKDITTYINDLAEGDWKSYDDTGMLRVTGFYKDGYSSGQWNWYWENGQLRDSGEYINGMREGEWKYYKENGELDRVEFFKNDKVIK